MNHDVRMQARATSPDSAAARCRCALLELASDQERLFDDVLRQYARERLLHLLAASPWGDQFVLFGAPAIEVRLGVPHRRLKSLDLACPGPGTARDVNAVVRAVSLSGGDGLRVDATSVRSAGDDSATGGSVRVKLFAYLESAQIPVQLDVTFNQRLAPEPEPLQLPSMLDQPGAAVMDVAGFDTIAAAKIQSIIDRGNLRARMKDFYDVWLCTQVDPLEDLEVALQALFECRGTPIPRPGEVPEVLAARYVNGRHAAEQWDAFNRTACPNADIEFSDVHHAVQRAALPAFALIGDR